MPSPLEKDTVLPASNPKSPYYVNLPPFDAKPIDNLVTFFKYWKYFIKSLIYYFKEIALVKEFETNLSYQLIKSVQFPGFNDLPLKVLKEVAAMSPTGSTNTTPIKDGPKNNTSHHNLTPVTTNGSKEKDEVKRPGLLKTKSNNSTFLKSSGASAPNLHKRTLSATSMSQPAIHNNNNNNIKIPEHYFADDSLFTNLPPLLLNYHQQRYQANQKLHKDLVAKLIPRLETLLKNVSSKIKEIKASLKNESFSNTGLVKEISATGQVINTYTEAIERYSREKPVLKRKLVAKEDRDDDDDDGVLDDPFLSKLQVDYQVKNQLIYENYMFASYVNLQNISRDLFTYVLKELTVVVDKFGKLQLNPEFYMFMKNKISTSSNKDWEYFISNNPSFLNVYASTAKLAKKENRNFKLVTLPYSESVHNKCIRFGILYKKLKILKNYNRHYYVLTCNYLHEFKMENEDGKPDETASSTSKRGMARDKIGGFIGHDSIPVKSYNLNDCVVTSKDASSFKFQLMRNSNKLKKFTFKCLNQAEYGHWFGDLDKLLKFGSNHLERYAFVQEQIKSKEEETARVKEAKRQAIAGKSKPLALRLDLDPVSSSTGLSGLFTPKINTPTPNGEPALESNPFDETFKDLASTAATSKAASPLHTPTLSPTDLGTVPHSPPHSPHHDEHQSYLRMQQEILRQQQQILNMQIQNAPQTSPSAVPAQFIVVDAKDANNLSRPGSYDSLSSFMPAMNGVQAVLDANSDILGHQKPVTFDIDHRDTPGPLPLPGPLPGPLPNPLPDNEDVPKMFIISNH